MAKTKVHGEFLKDSVVRFTAKAGENITKGQAVYISGVSGEKPVVSLADANDTAKMPAFGLAEATVSTNAEVEITSFGTLKGLDTSSYSLGDILYVDTTAGALTNNPSGLEATKLQNIGIVQRVHATSGSIKVGGAGRTNAVPNLDDGDIFIGDSNNKAVSDSFTNVLNSEAGISVGGSGIDVTGNIDASGLLKVGVNDTEYANNYLRFKSAGAGYIDHNTVGQDINFRISNSSALDTTIMTLDAGVGSVGINQTSPSSTYKLDVGGAIRSNTAAPGFHLRETDASNQHWTLGSYGGTFAIRDVTGGTYPLYVETATPSSTLYLDSTGNVGIGTTSPSNKLHVVGDVFAESGSFYVGDGGVVASDSTSRDLNFAIGNTTPKMTLDTSGNVGIGTTSPASLLHLKSSTPEIRIQSDNGQSANLTFGDASDSTRGGIEYTSTDDIVFKNNNMTEQMRIRYTGNVGIGTSSPSSELHVDSNNTDTTITIESDLDGSSLFTSGIDLKRETVSKGSRIESIRDASAGGVGLNFLTTADNAAEVSGTLTSRMVILEDGNVGIGTTSPSTKLDVNGAIRLTDATYSIYSSSASAVIGHIGNTANDLNIYSSTAGHNGLRFHVNGILPTDNSGTIVDNDADLGDPSYRFKDLYLSGTANVGKADVITSIQPELHFSSTYSYSNNRDWRFITNNFGNGNWGGFSLERSTGAQGSPSVAMFGIDLSGNMGVGVGGASGGAQPQAKLDVGGTIRTSTGILFGSDTAAANTLDDYEEGTWTPVMHSSGGSVSASYSYRSAYYIKIGNSVYVRWGFRLSSRSGGSGHAQVTGLPFTSKNYGSYQQPAAFVNAQNLTTDPDGPVLFYLVDNNTKIEGRLMNNADTGLPISYFQNGSWCIGHFTYDVS